MEYLIYLAKLGLAVPGAPVAVAVAATVAAIALAAWLIS